MKLNRWPKATVAGVAVLVVWGSFDPADARGRGAGARGVLGGVHGRAFTGHANRGHRDRVYDRAQAHRHNMDRGHADRGREDRGHVDRGDTLRGHADRGRRFDRRGIEGAAGGGSVDVPLTNGGYPSGPYGGGCRSLGMRAEVTGSAYWLARYRDCRGGY